MVALWLALALGCNPCRAGAWVQDQGSGQAIFGTTATMAFRWFDRKGRPRTSGKFQKQETTVAIEYGLADGLSVLAASQIQRQVIPTVDWQIQSAGASGLIGGKARLWSNEHSVLSFQATFQGAKERILMEYSQKLQVPAQLDLRASVGHNLRLADVSVFIDIQAGYRWHGGGNPDEIRLDAAVGLRPIPELLVMVQSFNTLALSGNRRFGIGPVRQHRIQTSVVYDMTENVSVQIGGFFSLKGRNTLNEQGIVLALWRRL